MQNFRFEYQAKINPKTKARMVTGVTLSVRNETSPNVIVEDAPVTQSLDNQGYAIFDGGDNVVSVVFRPEYNGGGLSAPIVVNARFGFYLRGVAAAGVGDGILLRNALGSVRQGMRGYAQEHVEPINFLQIKFQKFEYESPGGINTIRVSLLSYGAQVWSGLLPVPVPPDPPAPVPIELPHLPYDIDEVSFLPYAGPTPIGLPVSVRATPGMYLTGVTGKTLGTNSIVAFTEQAPFILS